MTRDVAGDMDLLLKITEAQAYLLVAVSLVELTADCVMKAVDADPELEPEGTAILRGLQDSAEGLTRAARFMKERSGVRFGRGPEG